MMQIRCGVLIALLLGALPALPADILYSVTDLGTSGGGSSTGYAINNAGQVVGSSYTSADDSHAFLYSNGKMTDLGTLGGSRSEGLGLNNAGQVTGWAETTTRDVHAFFYSQGQMRGLGTLT